MTLEEYIGNPLGKGGGAILNATARESMRNSYVEKFNNLMVREHGMMNYRIYKNSKKNKFYIWFKVPSETINKFYYDVVIEFFADSDVKEAGQNLFKYNARFYANDPAFVYTYAYVFNKNDLFIEELKSKMSRKALNEKPDEKNPYMQVGYIKSIYFAYLMMINRGLNKVSVVNSTATEVSDIGKSIGSMIDHADIKINAREEAGKKLEKEKKRQKQKEKQSKNVPERDDNVTKLSKNIKTTPRISANKTVAKISTVTKKTKRK